MFIIVLGRAEKGLIMLCSPSGSDRAFMSHLFRLPAWATRRLRSRRRCLSARRSVNGLLGVHTIRVSSLLSSPLSNSRCPHPYHPASSPIHGQLASASSPDMRRKTFTIFLPVITLHSVKPNQGAFSLRSNATGREPKSAFEIRAPTRFGYSNLAGCSLLCMGDLVAMDWVGMI